MVKSDAAATPPLRSDARANRRALLAAAAALFAERGVEVSYEEIAEHAGVGRATLYRHFPTRENLLIGLLGGLMDELEEAVNEFSGRPEGIFDLFDYVSRVQQRHVPIVDLVNQAVPVEELAATRRRFLDLLTEPLQRAQAAGLVRAELTVGDVRLLLVMVSSLTRATITDADRTRAVTLARSVLTGSLD